MKPPLLPMLATPAAPFDDEEYHFEVKWDGVRALAAVEAGGWRLWGRSGSDYTLRYPELAVLQRLPAGTVVDGELVVLRDGRADFRALLRRHQRCCPAPGHMAANLLPACYVLFDLLCYRGQSVMQETLVRRQARLRDLLERVREPVLVYADGVVGCGREFFKQVVAQGHEGVMAKQRASRYRPGKRSRAWRKIKPAGVLPCVIVGYRAGREAVGRLLLASLQAGELRYVGQVSRGLGIRAWPALADRLARRRRACSVVPCPHPACWVEPELYCRVRFQGWTSHGQLRHAMFAGWIEEPS
jgi:bifunctional non-homologous end joining protein LigD